MRGGGDDDGDAGSGGGGGGGGGSGDGSGGGGGRGGAERGTVSADRRRGMVGRRRVGVSLGRPFGWLWGAYAVSAAGSGLALSAFPMIAVLVLHAGSGKVAALSATGTAVGAVLAVPLGPWVEYRRKRSVMVAVDLIRFGVLLTVPLAYILGRLGFAQLLVVSVVVGAAEITFRAASGAALKSLVAPEHLLVANSRFESTTWTTTVLGPPLGGVAIGLFGPVATVVADAVSYLLSALGIRAIGGDEAPPETARTKARRTGGGRRVLFRGTGAAPFVDAAGEVTVDAAREVSAAATTTDTSVDVGDGDREDSSGKAPGRVYELLAGWRFILSDPQLRPFFLHGLLVNGLIMVSEPLLSVLMLGKLGFAPWEFGLAFSVPCIGGLIGSRLARRFAARYGERRVLLTSAVARCVWSIGLVGLGPGAGGLLLVMAVEFGLIFCCSVYNPLLATQRLKLVPNDRIARVLSSWSVTSKLSIAVLTGLWGGLASVIGPRAAIGLAGGVMLWTPLLLLPLRKRGTGRGIGSGPRTGPRIGAGRVRRRGASGYEPELTSAQSRPRLRAGLGSERRRPRMHADSELTSDQG